MSYSKNLQRSIDHCTYGDKHPSVVKTREFVRVVTSLLMTGRLHVAFPNKPIRDAALNLRDQVTDPDIIKLCDVVRKQPYPYGYVSRLARLLEQCDRESGKKLDKGGVK